MPYFGIKFHLGWLVGVLGRERDIDLEDTSFVGGTLWAFDGPFPMSEIIIDDDNFDVGFFGLI